MMLIIHEKLENRINSQYYIVAIVNKKLMPVLIDTGANWSHIGLNLVKEVYDLEKGIIYETYDEKQIKINKGTTVEIIFNTDLTMILEIPVDKNKDNDVLLGTDFLDKFEFEITNKNLILQINYKRIEIPRVNLQYQEIEKILREN